MSPHRCRLRRVRLRVHAALTTLALITIGVLSRSASAQLSRPSLDDFYERGRTRTEGLERCGGECDGRHVLGFLVGAEVSDPLVGDRHYFAPGLRLGVDAGLAFGPLDVVRSRGWIELLSAIDAKKWLADVTLDTSFFTAFGKAQGDTQVDVSIDTRMLARAELELRDVAQLHLSPYREWGAESEVALVGPKIDKDAQLALPLGVDLRSQTDDAGERLEQRATFSAAIAARGFPRGHRHHLQLDFARVTLTEWSTPLGAAQGWAGSAGYQRLSPDLRGIELWILGGYGTYRGNNAVSGVLAQVGIDVTDERHFEASASYDTHFGLDPRTNLFHRVHEGRVSARWLFDIMTFGLTAETVALDGSVVYGLTPTVAARVGRVELGARYRMVFGAPPSLLDAPLSSRFSVSADVRF